MKSLLSILILFYFHTLVAQGRIGDLSFKANSMKRNFETSEITLEGDIEVLYKDKLLSAETVTINTKDKKIYASGKARLTDLETSLEADSIEYNYKSKEATFHNAYLQSGHVIFEGKKITKTPEDVYLIDDAFYTSCSSCPYAWSIRGSQIEAQVGGYAKIDYPKVDLYGINILILPHIWVPLKTERQSGLLSPQIEHSSSGGLAFSQRLFWAINRSQDLTTRLKVYSKRAPLTEFDYRYVLSKNSSGQLKMGYVFDSENQWQAPAHRYYFDYRHNILLPFSIKSTIDGHYVSDLKIPTDFIEEVKGHGDPSVDSLFAFNKTDKDYHYNLSSKLYINLIKENPEALNEDSVYKLPSLNIFKSNHYLFGSPLNYNFSINYDNFYRKKYSFDRIINNQAELLDDIDQFNPNTDIMRTGQRLLFSPEISIPIMLGEYFSLLPKLKHTSALYLFDLGNNNEINEFSPFTNRSYLDSTLSLRTQFYGINQNSNGSIIKHTVEPEISFIKTDVLVPNKHRFFGPTFEQSHLLEEEPIAQENIFNDNNNFDVQFDYKDRVFNKTVLNFSLNQKWVKKDITKGHYKNIASLLLSQSYDLSELSASKPKPWSILSALLTMNFDFFETYTTASYYPYADVANSTTRIRFKDSAGNYFETIYTLNYSVDKDNTFDYEQRSENLSFGLGWRHRYLLLNSLIDYSLVQQTILSWGYEAYLYPPGNCWSLTLKHKQVLSGDTIINLGLDFKFDG